MEEIEAWCDGSSLGNPGAGGWAWWVSETRWRSMGYPDGMTNNRMELLAVHDLLSCAPGDAVLSIHLDSRYVLDAITKWSHGWRRNNWTRKDGGPVANRGLIEGILGLCEGRDLHWHWVRGHNGTWGNEQADTKARQIAARSRATGSTLDEGPGWA